MPKNLVKKAIILAWITIIYNIIEGVIAIAFGISEGSIALAGFGGDSLIEFASGGLVLWRFSEEHKNDKHLSSKREKQATKGIGILFFILAGIMLATSIYQLLAQNHPETTVPGIIISVLSLFVMFFLFNAKMKVGTELKSSTVLSDAGCTMACIKFSVILFLGSILFWIQPLLWWIDSASSIILAYFIYKEGSCTLNQANNVGNSCKCNE